MSDLISRKGLWEEIARLEELARKRVLDTPISSPCYQRYNAQLNERTNLKHIIADAKIAYDVDKVVEQLDNYLFEKHCIEGDGEIVKILEGGGVDE